MKNTKTKISRDIFFLRLFRVIKYSLLLCFIFTSSCLYAGDKKMTISIKNEKLEKVFDLISQQSNMSIIVKANDVNLLEKVSFEGKDIAITEVLDAVLKGQNLRYELKDSHIILYNKTSATAQIKQTKKIVVQGIVKDDAGEPLIGASIQEKGTSNGTVTDIDGNYKLEVTKNAKVIVSYIGYLDKEYTAADSKSQVIELKEDTQTLDELVVVGYGTMKKKDLMGATSLVDGDNLAINSNTSVGGALQGKMSGISIMSKGGFPGTDTSIKIRGVNSFGSGSNTSPLVIIDGVPVEGGFETLNPSDIQNVNILKDASSAAIYGSRAANGVILITTKSGKSGKSSVSVNASWGIQKASHIMDVLTAEEFVSTILEMRDNKKAISGGNPTTKYDGMDPASFGKGTVWSDHIYESAPTFNINTSVSGGTEKARYYLSTDFLNQDGISINTNFKKASLRANIEGSINENLKVGNNIHLAYRKTKGSRGNRYSDVIFNAPVIPAYDKDGSYGEPDPALTSSKNAIAEVAWHSPKNDNFRVLDNLFLEYKFLDCLKFRFNAGLDVVFNENKSFKPKFNDGGHTNSQNSYNENRAKDIMWVTDYLLYFDKVFKKHTINAMAGFSQQYFSKDNLLGAVKDFVSETSNMQIIDGGTNTLDRTLGGGKSELALSSYFGRVNYDYADKYLLSVNLRVDGSSRFKKDDRWGVFPSVSGAWRISEEDFFNVNQITSLKVRGSWGLLGNQSIGSWYPTTANLQRVGVILGAGEMNQSLNYGYVETALSNKKLQWEKTYVTNIGIDLGLFDNKLLINADYFIKITDGILRKMVLPLSVGMSAPNVNFAKVQNSGFDFEATYQGSINDFNYSISGNFSYLKNKIKKLSAGVNEEINNIGAYGGVTINRVGESIDALYGYKTGGLITTQEEADQYKAMGQGNAKIGRLKYKDLNGDGKIDGGDRAILGSHIPKYSVGLTLSANWRNFDFSTVFAGVFGRKQHSPMSFQNRFPNRNMSKHWYKNRWKIGENPSGKYPALIQDESYEEMTDLMVQNTSFLKLRSLTIGYKLPINKIHSRVFISGENLFTISSKSFDGFDPENGDGVGHYTNWGDDYPTPRIFLLGLNLTF